MNTVEVLLLAFIHIRTYHYTTILYSFRADEDVVFHNILILENLSNVQTILSICYAKLSVMHFSQVLDVPSDTSSTVPALSTKELHTFPVQKIWVYQLRHISRPAEGKHRSRDL